MTQRVAIIGTGISGLSAAWGLRKKYHLTLFERNAYLGGHAQTITLTLNNQKVPVDTGFIVYNQRNYPHLTQLFHHLKVVSHETSMSFSVQDLEKNFEYGSTFPQGIFAQRHHCFSPSFWQFLLEIVRFNKKAQKFLNDHSLSSLRVEDFLNLYGFSEFFQEHYLLPLGSSIWSCSFQNLRQFSAISFLKFLDNHGLLSLYNQPQWRSIQGGSQEYIRKLRNEIDAEIYLQEPIIRLERLKKTQSTDSTLLLTTASGKQHSFDHVIIATPADQALQLLGTEATTLEQSLLSTFIYSRNTAILHGDQRFMPRHRQAWASWNALKSDRSQQPISLTYWMNHLQNLNTSIPIFVTLNPVFDPDPSLVWGQYTYYHPQFTSETSSAQSKLNLLQNHHHTWYCGSYFGNGFHEDGIASGLKVAQSLGGEIPWLDSI